MVRAGEMRERVTILTLAEKTDKTGWEWTETRTTWAKVEKTGKRSLFSTVGAGREDKMREYSKTVQIIFLMLGIFTGSMLYLLRDSFISLYDVSEAAVSEAVKYINVIAVTMVGTCYQVSVLFGLVKSGGDISFVFKNDSFFVFVVVLPSAIIATLLHAPAWVVFSCLKCDQILKCFVAIVKVNSYNWMKNLTR